MTDDAEIELSTKDGTRLTLTPQQFAVINPEGARTIGELHDSLPVGEWVELPRFGIRVKRWTDETP